MRRSPEKTIPATDTLEISLETYPHDGTDFVVVALRANGDALADFRYYATDLEELTRSLDVDGEFFILTCWCGVPECAGIADGVAVRHQGNQTRWHVPQPAPPRDFVFEKAAIQVALLACAKERRRFVAERSYSNKIPHEIAPMQNEPFFALLILYQTVNAS